MSQAPKLAEEVIKIKTERKEIENKKTIEKIVKSKSLFFEKINKIGNPLARLTKEKESVYKSTQL